MLICYPDHYIPSTMPIINLDQDENITKSDEYKIRCNLEDTEVFNTYLNNNIFDKIDEEYVNAALNNITN